MCTSNRDDRKFEYGQAKSGAARNPRCLRSSVKFPQSVMIRAVMSSAGVGPLCFLKSTVNATIYQDILQHFMLPSADKLYGDADFIYFKYWVHRHEHTFQKPDIYV